MKAYGPSLFNNFYRLHSVIAVIFFALGAYLYFCFYKSHFFYLVDDSGVEIIQVRLFSGWPISGFMQEYLGDTIESFYGYFMMPFIKILGNDISVFKLAMGLVFATSTALFYILLSRLFKLPVAILTAIAYLTSAYTIWYPCLLLRNAFSPLFTICLLLSLSDLFDNKFKRGFWGLIIFSFLASNTYSSFKAVIPALLASSFIAGFFFYKNKTLSITILLCGIMLIAMTAILFYFTHIPASWLFHGGYMYEVTDLYKDRSFSTYLGLLIRSIILPVYQNINGFLAEPSHFIFGRPMLNVWLYGFWGVGIIAAILKIFKKKEVMPFICLMTIVLSSLVLCFGGPSLKTFFALAPFEFIIIAYGINAICQMLHFNKAVVFLCGVLVLSVSYLETGYVITISAAKSGAPDAAAQDIGLFLHEHDQDFDFTLFEAPGLDLMRAFYPNWAKKTTYVDMSDESGFHTAVDNLLTKYNRLFIITVQDNPIYLQLQKDKRFCFKQYINDRAFAALFVSCMKNDS